MSISCVSNEETRVLDLLCREARGAGASRAVGIGARDVVVDPRARLKCQVPLCSHYGKSIMCPPNVMRVEEFRHYLDRYRWGIILQVELPVPAEIVPSDSDAPFVQRMSHGDFRAQPSHRDFRSRGKQLLTSVVNRVEGMAMREGYNFAAGFVGGSCALCDVCVGPGSPKGCRKPFQARPAMEAVGIDVFSTAERAGLPLTHLLRGIIRWTGLVLVD